MQLVLDPHMGHISPVQIRRMSRLHVSTSCSLTSFLLEAPFQQGHALRKVRVHLVVRFYTSE